jgi:uncharacterized membrane protein YvbJ
MKNKIVLILIIILFSSLVSTMFISKFIQQKENSNRICDKDEVQSLTTPSEDNGGYYGSMEGEPLPNLLRNSNN